MKARTRSRAAHRSSSGMSRMRDQMAASSVLVAPRGAQVTLVETRHLAGDPRRHVHAVGDRGDGPLVDGRVRPERREHLARDVAVQLAHGVDRAGRPHRQRRHVELAALTGVVAAERHEHLAVAVHRSPAGGELFFHQREGERVVAGRHRRVRREDRRPPDFGEGVLPAEAGREIVAHPLQDDERRVALVEVPDRRLQTERAQRQHAAEAQDDLLLQPRLFAAAIEPGRQLAIPFGGSAAGRCRAGTAARGRAGPPTPARARCARRAARG